jgi:hypothetical protein
MAHPCDRSPVCREALAAVPSVEMNALEMAVKNPQDV